ncbi:PAS domain-containing protein [Sphingomonas sinipercae]|uniref:PAS domain-containing protein n=1 Tax=Sphingomonas sinipercae TaxID=2714944 RepID=A0A6G7ZMG7_9SPHN|nr:LuxR family transcriptional regulator [Sphingomonas sinipercae]QIL02110.1 PAS domain-containing protein [Sphingomonas sinipercae]
MHQADAQLSPDDVDTVVKSIANTPIATIVTDCRLPDNPIIAVNAAFEQLTGYSREEAVGRNCRFLSGEATEPEAQLALGKAVRKGASVVVELTNYRKDGRAFRNAVMIAPVRDDAGRVTLFVGSQMDVSECAAQGGLRNQRAKQLVDGLTRRQRQVLKLMSAGFRNKQIGGELGIDEKTVKMHRARMLQSLGVTSSADAIRIAVEADLRLSDAG